jgi:hypothetical protein
MMEPRPVYLWTPLSPAMPALDVARPGYLFMPVQRISVGSLSDSAEAHTGLDTALDGAVPRRGRQAGQAPALDRLAAHARDEQTRQTADARGNPARQAAAARARGLGRNEQARSGQRDAGSASGAPAVSGGDRRARTARGRAQAPEAKDPPPVTATIPVHETGTITLEARSPSPPRPSPEFGVSTALSVNPAPIAGRPKTAAAAIVARHQGVFADAITRMGHLHAALIAIGQSQASAEISAAARRSEAAQQDLDDGLSSLDAALNRARNDLDIRGNGLQNDLEAQAAEARSAIVAAAARASSAITTATTAMSGERDAIGKEYWDPLPALLGTQEDSIRTAATAAIGALNTVDTQAQAQFASSASSLEDARNEEKLVRLPARARTEAHELELARDYDARLINAKAIPINQAKTDNMAPLTQRIDALKSAAPAALGQARHQALKQLDKQVEGLRNALVSGRACAHAALVGQHEAARKQIVGAGRQRMRAEAEEAEGRLGGNWAAAEGMAAGMTEAARSLRNSLAAEHARPADQFAQVVVNSSTSLVTQLEAAAPPRTAQLRGSGSASLSSQDVASSAAARGFRSGSEAAAGSLESAAGQAAGQLERQIAPTLPELNKLATPVARSIDGFVRPLKQSAAGDITALENAATVLRASLVHEYETGQPLLPIGPPASGAAAPPASATPAAGSATGGEAQQAPKEAGPNPMGFVTRMGEIPPRPLGYPPLDELAKRTDSAVSDNVKTRAEGLHNSLSASDVGTTFTYLRGLTHKRGRAIEDSYDQIGGDLRSDIDSGLRKVFSTEYTDDTNVKAALADLDGNAVEGARLEMEVAIHLWNDNERVQLAARSLTPEQMRQLDASAAGHVTLESVHDDLNDATQEIFDQLRAGHTERADAIVLRNEIDEARKKEGQEGADRTADVIAAASRGPAPSDALSGADPLGLGLDRDRALGHPDQDSETRWARVRAEFATVRGVAAATGGAGGGADPAAALVAYATRPLDYWVQSNDPAQYDPDLGPTYERVHLGIEGPNADLISDLVRTGEGSPEARASRLAVEMQRAGGPNMERLSTATYDPRMNSELAMDPRDPNAAQHAQDALARAQADREAMLRLYAQRYAPNMAGDTAGLANMLAERTRASLAGEPERAAYAASMIADECPDPVLALNYALNTGDTKMDVVRRTMGGLRRDQLDEAVARYNLEARSHGRPELEDRLGLYGRHGGDITGDQTQEVERLMLGVAVTDRERAEVAALQARQQREGTGALGHAVNTLGGEEQRLDTSYNQLLTTMGVTETDFDARGRLWVHDPITGRPVGNFAENGVFVPTATASLDNLNACIIGAKLSAEGYQAATDRMANYITTALMVAAAVVTTALTGGAAAGFWAVALTATAVTLTAGVIGIGANYALKGSRYTAHEAEHDLAVAAVQAATAGVGAGLGVALKGAAIAAGQAGPSLLGEMAVGGVTSAAGGAGQAALDHKDVGAAFLRGLVGGSLGAAAARPFGRLLSNEAGQIERAMVRSATNATSGAASRAGEIAVDTATGEDQRGLGEKLEDIRGAAVQNAVQGGLEQGGEHIGETVLHNRAPAARGAPAEARATAPAAHGAGVEPHLVPGTAVSGHGAVGEPPTRSVAEPPVSVGPHAGPVEERGRPAIPPPAPDHPVPLPEIPRPPRTPSAPIMPDGPHVDPFSPTIHPPAPEPLAPTVPAPSPVPRQASAVEEAAARGVHPRAASSEEEPLPSTRRGPPPLPTEEFHRAAAAKRRAAAAVPELLELPEGSPMMPPDPRSRVEAIEMLRNSMRDDPIREIAVYVNTATGEHVLIQGNRQYVAVEVDAAGRPVGIAGQGIRQVWKEILDVDQGNWRLVAHNHPGEADASHAGYSRRLPSGRGGDFMVLVEQSLRAGGHDQYSEIHVTYGGRTAVTEFSFEPGLKRPFGLIYDDPATGQRVFRRFVSMESYGEFFERLTGGSPNLEHGSGPAMAERPGEIEMLHGTHSTAAASIREKGIQLSHIAHEHQDFGRAFYLTLDEANANLYAEDAAGTQRARARGDTPEVMRVRFRLEDLGDIVDVRPGGEHRAMWEEFLRRQPPDPVLGFTVPPDFLAGQGAEPRWRTVKDYITSPIGIEQRGVVFTKFLEHIGMADVPVVRGDLGGVGTSGRVAKGVNGEQIAIRTQEAADRMSAALRHAMGERPASAAPAVPHSGALSGLAEAGATTTSPSEPPPGAPIAAARPGHDEDFRDLTALHDIHQRMVDARKAIVAATTLDEQRAAWTANNTAIAEADALLVQMGMVPLPGQLSAPDAVSRQRRINATPSVSDKMIHALGMQVDAAITRRLPLETGGALSQRIAAGDRNIIAEDYQAAGVLHALGEDLAFAGKELPPGGLPGVLGRSNTEFYASLEAQGRLELAKVESYAATLEAPRRARLEEMLLLGGPAVERVLLATSDVNQAHHMGATDVLPTPVASAHPVPETVFQRLSRPIPITPADAASLVALLSDPARSMSTPPRRRTKAGITAAMSPGDAAATVARWQTSGMTPQEVSDHVAAFQDVLARPDRKGPETGLNAARRADNIASERAAPDRAAKVDAIPDPLLKSFANANPDVARIAWTAPEMLMERWQRYNADHLNGALPTAEGFAAYLRAYSKSMLAASFGELTAAFELGRMRNKVADRYRGLEVLKGPQDVDPDTGKSTTHPNQGGSDLFGVMPSGSIVYSDDKAEAAGSIQDVTAFTKNLAENMKNDAEKLHETLARHRDLGLAVNPQHEEVAGRIRDCAVELAKLGPVNLDTLAANPTPFMNILAKYRIDLIVTSATGNARQVSAKLKKIGVHFVE